VANSGWNLWNFRRHLIGTLLKEGYQVVAIAPEDRYTARLASAFPELEIIRIRHLSAKGKNPLQDLQLMVELWRIYRRYRPLCVLHFTIKPNIFGGLAAQLSRSTYIGTITGLGYAFLRRGWIQWMVSGLYWLGLRKARFVVFQNMDDADLFHKRKIVSRQRGRLIQGSGVDARNFPYTPLPPLQPFRFLFVGRLLFDKGIYEFVEAAGLLSKEYEGIEFWVAGDADPDYPAVVPQKILEEWRQLPHFRWLGHVGDIRPIIEDTHVMVLPSHREGMPRAVLEAMSMGRPIITTETAGCRDTVIPGENGWLVPVMDESALYRMMKDMVRRPLEELSRMGQLSRRLVEEKFEVRKVNESYLRLLREPIKI
jgi:glycosyltransferase involved in cell wall biosynthesis